MRNQRLVDRSGSTPDALVDAMARAGFELNDDEQAHPGIPGNLTLAEQLTGVRVTAELLDNATYSAGIVQLPPVDHSAYYSKRADLSGPIATFDLSPGRRSKTVSNVLRVRFPHV
ncbi:DUF6461 domain-containing protein [Nocardia sp. CA-084685]|uniref:DUF6461 domain-containing protein n=1 Tax=Nocardia sp. CA-084685 TaxID=3239970 RepID=UPI003D964575